MKRSRAFAYTYMLSHNYHYATTTAKAERRIVDSPPMLSHNNSYLTQAWDICTRRIRKWQEILITENSETAWQTRRSGIF